MTIWPQRNLDLEADEFPVEGEGNTHITAQTSMISVCEQNLQEGIKNINQCITGYINRHGFRSIRVVELTQKQMLQ